MGCSSSKNKKVQDNKITPSPETAKKEEAQKEDLRKSWQIEAAKVTLRSFLKSRVGYRVKF